MRDSSPTAIVIRKKPPNVVNYYKKFYKDLTSRISASSKEKDKESPPSAVVIAIYFGKLDPTDQ